MIKQYQGSRLDAWIRLISDPHSDWRGFSILGREMKILGYEPVWDEMQDLAGNKQQGKFWVVEAKEVYRSIPELRRFPLNEKSWLFPVEFCDIFVRPDYYQDTPVRNIILL